jgi:hypothetical protein
MSLWARLKKVDTINRVNPVNRWWNEMAKLPRQPFKAELRAQVMR